MELPSVPGTDGSSTAGPFRERGQWQLLRFVSLVPNDVAVAIAGHPVREHTRWCAYGSWDTEKAAMQATA